MVGNQIAKTGEDRRVDEEGGNLRVTGKEEGRARAGCGKCAPEATSVLSVSREVVVSIRLES